MNAEKKALEAFEGDEFMELKFRMMKKLREVDQAVTDIGSMDASTGKPEDKIRKQQEVREMFKTLTGQLDQLDGMHARETRKKKSKFSQAELVNRGELKDSLKDHIAGLKEDFLTAYTRHSGGGGGGGDGGAAPRIQNFEAFRSDMGRSFLAMHTGHFLLVLTFRRRFYLSPAAKKSANAGGAGEKSVKIEQEAISDDQKMRMQQIEMRNLDQDRLLDQIGEV